MVPEGSLPNHTFAAPFNVVGKAMHITSSGVICKSIKVLNDSMWSKGSLEPSKDSNWGRRNFGGSGRFNISMMNGESVLWIIPSKFSTALSFTAFLSSSISLLMLWSSLSFLDEFSFGVLVLPFVWLSDPSSFYFLRSSDAFLHSGFPWSLVIPHSGIQQLSSALHFGKSLLPNWLSGLGFAM